MLHSAVVAIVWLFPISELALALRARASQAGAQSQDRRSLALLWAVFGLAIAMAVTVASREWAPLPLGRNLRDALVLGLMGSGILLRWVAILTLGRYFTVDVAVHADQAVVRTGPYAWVRHPSYSGLLLAFLGLGLQFRDALGLVVLMVPACLVVWHRIRIEEGALLRALGEPYSAYCRETRRLVPGIL